MGGQRTTALVCGEKAVEVRGAGKEGAAGDEGFSARTEVLPQQ